MGWYGRKRAVLTEEQKAERAAAKAAKDSRKAECQVCGRNHSVDKRGNVVLHGYKRPGHGWIQGRCFGAGHVDYTQGKDALEAWLVEVIAAEGRAATATAEYDRGEVIAFETIEQVIVNSEHGPYVGAARISWAPGVSEVRGYRARFARAQRAAKATLSQIRDERARVEARIEAWIPPTEEAS